MKTITTLQEHCKRLLEVDSSQKVLDAFALDWCQNNDDIRLYQEKDEGQHFSMCTPISESVVEIEVIYWDYRKTDTGHFEWTYTYKVDVTTGLEVE